MKLSDRLKGLVPLASKVLGTVHPLAGMAAEAIGAALGVKTEGRPRDEVEREIAKRIDTATPDQLLALSEANHRFELQMETLGYTEAKLEHELHELEMKDRQDARSMATKTSIRPQLSIFLVMLSFVCILTGVVYTLLTAEAAPRPEILSMLSMILGVALREMAGAAQFFTGTTHSSSRKTDMLGQNQSSASSSRS